MSLALRFSHHWQVYPTTLAASNTPFNAAPAFSVPQSSHLQPALYPDKPYWGEHIRAVNESGWLYELRFPTPDVPFRRARLRFEAVDYYATAWLNEALLGQHEGNFNPFTFDVTPLLKRGTENRLLVHVSSPWDKPNPRGNYPIDHVIRGLVKGLYEHGEGVLPPDVNPLGIWRPVWLLLDDGISIDSVQIRAGMDGSLQLTSSISSTIEWTGNLALAIAAENHAGAGAHTAIPVQLAPGNHRIEHTLSMDAPQLWWSWDHGQPHLYRLTQQLGAATHAEVFGFRSIHLERSRDRFTYWLNDRPIYVRGSSYLPGIYLSQHDRASLARDVALAKDANLNLLRVHIHVLPPELYDICDQAGMLVWQDFELNWVQECSPAFEARARTLQKEMLAQLGNHPALVTWCCHNEPTMIFARRANLEHSPDPALYADALAQDSTRPVFICSGQMEEDWQRAGDVHTYYGAIWSKRYTDVYRHHPLLNTEFGFEAPANPATLQQDAEVWERLCHLEPQIGTLWDYQAELIQYHVEHFRRLRAECNAGYVHFWLLDPVPQVGCGVLDAARLPKSGYDALRLASQPLHVALEHDGSRAYALWVFNDTMQAHPAAQLGWQIFSADNQHLLAHRIPCDIAANASQRIAAVDWKAGARIELWLEDARGKRLTTNTYRHPFQPASRPAGYPWKFDPLLGTKVFNRSDAPSMIDQNIHPLLKKIPLPLREEAAEWAMRQQLPVWLQSLMAKAGDWLIA